MLNRIVSPSASEIIFPEDEPSLPDDICPLVCCSPRPLAVVDVETTGLDPKTNEIVELAILLCDPNGEPEGRELVTRIKPSGPMGATEIHGISAMDVHDAPTFHDIAGTVVDHLAGRTVVAHNAYFDVRFLSAELTRVAHATNALPETEKFPMFPTLCTMWSSDVIGLGGRISLAKACAHIGVTNTAAHTADADAVAAMHLARHILGTARRTGTHVRKFGDPNTPPLTHGDFPALPR